MVNSTWVKEFPGSVTVCALDGTILEMNDMAAETFKADGGMALIGKNLLDCHSEVSKARLQQMFATEQKNVYTIEKKGVKKLIYQTPWYEAGVCQGFVEISVEIPEVMPHFIRE